MPDYSFSFDPAASGLPYTIKNRAGETVDSGTLDESDDVAKVTVTLPWGTYDGVASVAPAPYASTPAYFAKGDQLANQPGASETAKFIGTVTGDTSGDQFPLTFVADGEVDWASVDEDGNIALPGPVMVAMTYRFAVQLDMTDATGFSTAAQGPESDVTIKASRVPGDGFQVNCGGPLYAWPVGTSGLVLEGDAVEEGITQSNRAAANAAMTIKGTVNALAYDDESVAVTDGEVTAAVAVWITRQPLPDAPTLP